MLYSPPMFLYGVFGLDMHLVILTGFLMVIVSFMPDLDILVRKTRLRTRHRGITHTFLFGFAVGALLSVTLGLVYGSLGWVMGFVAGFGGTISHLVGDIFTCGQPRVKPFYPFSGKELAFGFFEASDKTVNNAMLAFGAMTFTISYILLCSL